MQDKGGNRSFPSLDLNLPLVDAIRSHTTFFGAFQCVILDSETDSSRLSGFGLPPSQFVRDPPVK